MPKLKRGKRRIVLLPGMATAPRFMEPIGEELAVRLMRRKEELPEVQIVFPYGDWGRNPALQLREIIVDLALSPRRAERSVGAQRVRAELQGLAALEEVLIVGHSGGGVAGLHLSRWLRRELPHVRLLNVLVGSPKCRVMPGEQETVLSIRALLRGGRTADPVGRLGSWGGWERTPSGLVRWNRWKFAPRSRIELPLLGGHADYFRGHAPYVDETGVSNLEKTAACMEDWLFAKP